MEFKWTKIEQDAFKEIKYIMAVNIFVKMDNLATKPPSREDDLMDILAILTNMWHKPGGSRFEAGRC